MPKVESGEPPTQHDTTGRSHIVATPPCHPWMPLIVVAEAFRTCAAAGA